MGKCFNLENMVKAGVNLEEVSSVLFKKNAIPVPNVEEKPENKEENNDLSHVPGEYVRTDSRKYNPGWRIPGRSRFLTCPVVFWLLRSFFPGAKFSIYEVQESSVENTITYIFHRAFKSDGVVVNDEARAIWDAFNQYADYRDRETTTFDFEGPTLRFSSLVKGYFNITSFNSRSIPVQNPSWASFFDESEDKYNGIKFGAPVRLHGATLLLIWALLEKYHLALGVRLSSFVLTEKVSLLPLFAYWKAYYDRFGIQFNSNYYVTNLAKIMKHPQVTRLRLPIWKFVHDLGSCWYTEDQDFVSAHISDLTNSAPAGMAARFIDTSEEGFPIYDAGVVDGADGQHSHIDQVWHGNLASEYLKRIYRWITVILLLIIAVLISLVILLTQLIFLMYVSQSDTLATSGDEGVNLGAQAGMGIGKIKDKKCRVFKYTSNEHGFVVSMYSIVPSSGYVQGVARQNRCIRKLDFYNAEFDALGMETSSKSDIVGANDWPIAGDSPLSQTFGFIPRYSGLKVVQNIANGDFSLRGVRDNFLPLHA
ncbi:unnamed protein product [Cylicocyclus nassatus]|uniref:Uncharacterized protein n=1 Tax=Cylicocyclus nassatus TaxID=53992 RepID=A0AA36GJH0_CYLNA|nr:unnamed protein product [Cylicocyclus nassatus]